MELLALPEVQIAIAGASGGLARWIFLKTPWMDGLGHVVLGLLLAFYVSPYFLPLIAGYLAGFSTDAARLPTFAAFVTGVGGVAVMGFLLDLVNYSRKQLRARQRVSPDDTNGGAT